MALNLVRTHDMSKEPVGKEEYAADALLRSIESELSDVDYFTRDDLLYLDTFSHVATITRYGYVRMAVSNLVRRRKILERGRTHLLLPGKRDSYMRATAVAEMYNDTIRSLLAERRRPFMVMDIVTAWTTDEHLTTNAKRVHIRKLLRHMVTKHEAKMVHGFMFAIER